MNATTKHQPEEYVGIELWGKSIGSFPYYVRQEQYRASRQDAPIDAVYHDRGAKWACVSELVADHPVRVKYEAEYARLVLAEQTPAWKEHAAPLDVQAPAPVSTTTTDKTCNIAIHNVHGWELDAGMARYALERASQYIDNADVIDIYPQQRVPADAPAYRNPGWLEWVARIHWRDGKGPAAWLELHFIQRTPDAEYESHS